MTGEKRTTIVEVGGRSFTVTISVRSARGGLVKSYAVSGIYNGRYCEGPQERSEAAAIEAWVKVCGDPHGGRFEATS